MAKKPGSKMKSSPTKSSSGKEVSKFRSRWRHVAKIDELIKSGCAPDCGELMKQLEVSRRTIMRDIEFMKYDLGAPIEYDYARRGYVYTEDNWSLPNIRVTQGELLAMAVAEKAIQAYGNSPWARPLQMAFEKITTSLPQTVEISSKSLTDRIDFGVEGIAIVDDGVLQALDTAIRENRQVEMDYHPLEAEEETRYRLNPYLLLRRQGAWYLVAKDRDSGQVPMFNLSRVRKLKLLDSRFKYVLSDFDRETYLSQMAQMYHGQSEFHVVIDFTEPAATLVEERIWYPQQKYRRLKNGRLRFEVTVNHLWDIIPWVLRWGSQAKVIRPKELVEYIANEAKATVGIYSQQGCISSK